MSLEAVDFLYRPFTMAEASGVEGSASEIMLYGKWYVSIEWVSIFARNASPSTHAHSPTQHTDARINTTIDSMQLNR